MKRILAVMALGLLGACGSASNSSDASAALSLELKADLPQCSAANQSLVAYVKAEKALYTCQDGNWELVSQPKTEVATLAKATTVQTSEAAVSEPAGFDIAAAKKILAGYYSTDPRDLGSFISTDVCYWASEGVHLSTSGPKVPREYVEAVGCKRWVNFDVHDTDEEEAYQFLTLYQPGSPLDGTTVWFRQWSRQTAADKYNNGERDKVVTFEEAFGPQKSE